MKDIHKKKIIKLRIINQWKIKINTKNLKQWKNNFLNIFHVYKMVNIKMHKTVQIYVAFF